MRRSNIRMLALIVRGHEFQRVSRSIVPNLTVDCSACELDSRPTPNIRMVPGDLRNVRSTTLSFLIASAKRLGCATGKSSIQ